MSRKTDPIHHMGELIKNGQYQKAKKIGRILAKQPLESINDEFWVIYRMCFSDYKSLKYVYDNMQQCATFSSLKGSDLLLNCALAAIREQNLYTAAKTLPAIRELCKDNKFRLAKSLTIEGRIAYAKHDTSAAISLFNASEALWQKANCLSQDPWRKYNSLYLLKAMVANGVSYEARKKIAEAEIYGANRTRLHNFRAMIINESGTNKVDDQLMKVLRIKFS